MFPILLMAIEKNNFSLSAPIIISIINLLCFTISIIPIFYFLNSTIKNDEIFLVSGLGSFFYFHSIQISIFASLAVSIPYLFNIILDYEELYRSHFRKISWVLHFQIAFWIIFPNLVYFILTEATKYCQETTDNDLSHNCSLIFLSVPSIIYSQFISLIGCLLAFLCLNIQNQPQNSNKNYSSTISISIVSRSYLIMLTFFISRLLMSINLLLQGSEVVSESSMIFFGLGILQVILLCLQILRSSLSCMADHMSSDFSYVEIFSYTLALLVYVVFTESILIGLHSASRVPSKNQNSDSFLLSGFIWVMICLNYFFSMFPIRKFKFLSELKEEKLVNRLNMIRYVSHEMRTPLNTSLMGIDLISSVISRLKNLLHTILSEHLELNTSLDSWDLRGKSTKQPLTDSQVSKIDKDKRPVVIKEAKYATKSPEEEEKEQDSIVHVVSTPSMVGTHGDSSPVVPAPSASPDQKEHYKAYLKRLRVKVREIDHNLNLVEESCRVSLATLDDLLTFDKLDEKKLEIDPDKINPLDYFYKIVKPFQINASQLNVDFSLSYSPTMKIFALSESPKESLKSQNLRQSVFRNSALFKQLSKFNLIDIEEKPLGQFVVQIDPFKFSQVVRNLISNAIKFTPSRGKVQILAEVVDSIEEDQKSALNLTWKPVRSSRGSIASPVSSTNGSAQLNETRISHNWSHNIDSKRCCASVFRKRPSIMQTSPLIRPEMTPGQHGQFLKLSVIDSGAGISPENQKLLFGQYVQFDSKKLQQGKGSGLGLWISKRIMELHKGQIGVSSAGEGKGSVFYLYLPIYKSSELKKEESLSNKIHLIPSLSHLHSMVPGHHPTEKTAKVSLKEANFHTSLETFGQFSRANPKILIVDDTIVNRKVVRNMLESSGFEVVEASNGVECIEVVKKYPNLLNVARNNGQSLSGSASSQLSGFFRKSQCSENSESSGYLSSKSTAVMTNDPIEIILIDDQMPTMCGPEAIGILRTMDPPFRGLIFGVTGNYFASDVENFMSQGANGVFPKPFDLKLFISIVEEIKSGGYKENA